MKQEVVNAYNDLPDEIRKNFSGKNGLRDFLSYYVGNELLYRMAKRRNIDKDPAVQEKVFELKKQVIIQYAVIAEIEESLKNVDQEKIELFYRANVKKYNNKPMREVFQQVADDYKQERMQKTMSELQRSLLNSTDVYLFPELL